MKNQQEETVKAEAMSPKKLELNKRLVIRIRSSVRAGGIKTKV